MMQLRTFPTRAALRRLPFGLADVALLFGVLALLYAVARVGAGALVSFRPPEQLPSVSLDPRHLPYYAARSTLRMIIALIFSLLFTLSYGYVAAHSRRAERVMVPLLDILQSVPVLGFLSITVTGFIALFPGSLLGLEAASIFAVFTAQAWNMTFSFYQSLTTLPRELDEMTTLYRLSRWERFTRLEVPSSIIGLTWNAMMSFGGGWFFVAASEAISVLNQSYTLPGIGSYVALAVEQRDFRALMLALLTMAVVIVFVDQFFWKPLIAWADKFRLEQSAASEAPRSWVLELLRAARVPRLVGDALAPLRESVNHLLSRLGGSPAMRSGTGTSRQRWGDWIYNGALLLLTAWVLVRGVQFIASGVGVREFAYTALLGLATFGRVVLLLVFSTVVWTPVGVAIGFNPRLARVMQPVALLLASFPANFLFPFATLFFIRAGVSINWGGILLMALGAQWYILFNTIAGAMSIPTELREMATNMGLRGWKLWRALIIPGIFPAWVTGGLTASGGAWNASIVAEVVSWGATTLTATGLGAYISRVTGTGDWPRIVLGVGMMSVYVVGLNRLFWRRLYHLAETRYRLG
jgi:NitT/TauT family transport system permease protein